MEPLRDPEGYEARNLHLAGRIAGKDVLEIGCGDGWLTWQYASMVKRITGIDPLLAELRNARTSRPAGITSIGWVQTMAEGLPFAPGMFDIAVFSNSL